jgi:hypothetical protein
VTAFFYKFMVKKRCKERQPPLAKKPRSGTRLWRVAFLKNVCSRTAPTRAAGGFFKSLYSDKRNILQPDGFVFEAADNRLPEKGRRVSCVRHVFLKENETAAEYTYMGPSVCEERYSDTQAKLLYAELA